jgi:hypothetical protein
MTFRKLDVLRQIEGSATARIAASGREVQREFERLHGLLSQLAVDKRP